MIHPVYVNNLFRDFTHIQIHNLLSILDYRCVNNLIPIYVYNITNYLALLINQWGYYWKGKLKEIPPPLHRFKH